MNVNEVLNKLLAQQEENIIITDVSGKAFYVSQKCCCAPEIILKKAALMDDDMDEMEFFDISIRVRRNIITCGGETFTCYTFSDISEYTSLMKELSEYTRVITRVADFQSSIMKQLKLSYDTFLPGLCDYCGTRDVIMLMQTGSVLTMSTCDSEVRRSVVSDVEKYKPYLELRPGKELNGYYCIASDRTDDCAYSVLLRPGSTARMSSFAETSIHNVISLFIENSIMRDRIIFESEHDKLTGLYNKGKYMSMVSQCFGRPETIAVFNFDVNNLKSINDNCGHEMGDRLIVKAAQSIAAVTSGNVMGFRVGGDEYVMVALGVTREQAEDLRRKWENALEKSNAADDGLFCAMACGIAFGQGSYEYKELSDQADSLMYASKKQMKENGVRSHVTGAE